MIPAIGLIAGTLAVPSPAQAHTYDGALDRSFGTGGTVTTDFAGNFDSANALVVQAGGKLVAAGEAGVPDGSGATDFGLARYHRDGALDRSFGTGGTVTTDFFGDGERVTALVEQPGGKVVAAGAAFTGGGANPDFALARYHRDGTLDVSFGTGGKVTTDFGAHDVANALVVQADGKLVVAGFTFVEPSLSSFALARYHADGSLDRSFGTGGRVTTVFTGTDVATALLVQADGRLVAAGDSETATNRDFALARYNPDGTLDTRFGVGGKVTTDFTATPTGSTHWSCRAATW